MASKFFSRLKRSAGVLNEIVTTQQGPLRVQVASGINGNEVILDGGNATGSPRRIWP